MFEILFVLGAIMLIGFLGHWAFQKTRIPEPVILILVGFIIGEAGLFWFAPEGIDPFFVKSLAPIFGAIALVFLLFDAGMLLDISKVVWQISFSTVFSLANIALSLLITVPLLYFVFGWTLESALLAGAVLAGPSALSATAILDRFPATNKIRGVLSIEGIIATIAISILAMTTLQYAGSYATPATLVQSMAYSFAFSLVLGAFVGILWINLLGRFRVARFGYLLTIAVMLMLFFIDFSLTQIGIVSVIVAGIVIGNYSRLLDVFKIKWGFSIGESFRAPQDEITMLIKTFFFAYIGLTLSATGLTLENVFIGALLTCCLFLARLLIVRMMNVFRVTLLKEDFILAAMLPRDILTAALAVFAFLPTYRTSGDFAIDSVFIAILFATLFTTGAVNYYERTYRKTLLFKKEIRLKDGTTAIIRAVTHDDFGKMRKFINELVSEGALIAFDKYLKTGDEISVMQNDLVKANRGESILWVAVRDGKMLARAKAEKMELRARKNVSVSIYVAKEARRLGLGKLMLEMLIDEAQKRFEPKNIYLSVIMDNKPAIRLYKKLGFKFAGKLPEWIQYENSYVDEYFMKYEPGRKAGKKAGGK